MKEFVTEEKRNGTRLAEGAFAERDDLTEIELPADLEDIGEVAFFGCGNLRQITFPEGLRYIREEAFGESGLRQVRFPQSLEEIGEKAFFSCPELRRIEIPSPETKIGPDAFGSCPHLTEGYVACGYPPHTDPPEELLYTLLWCTCPDRHTKETTERAERFIREKEGLVMEHILKTGNTAAMTGLADQGLLRAENLDAYISEAGRRRLTEITALLLSAAGKAQNDGDFDL